MKFMEPESVTLLLLAQGLFLRQFILQDIFNCLKLLNIFLAGTPHKFMVIMSNAPAMQEKLRVISHRACIWYKINKY